MFAQANAELVHQNFEGFLDVGWRQKAKRQRNGHVPQLSTDFNIQLNGIALRYAFQVSLQTGVANAFDGNPTDTVGGQVC